MQIVITILALLLFMGCGNDESSVNETQNSNNNNNTNRDPFKHRELAESCSMERPWLLVPSSREGCSEHEDCSDGDNGRCVPGRDGNVCTYDQCFQDSDCDDTQWGIGVCGCRTVDDSYGANVCLYGDCEVDADCGEAGFCSPSFGNCGYYSGVVGFFCHTPDDECINDEDCSGEHGAYCAYDRQRGVWACSTNECVG